MSLGLILLAIVLAAASGLPGLCMARSSPWGHRIAVAVMCGAAVAGLVGAGAGLRGGQTPVSDFPWPAAGDSLVGLDALSAFFLVPVFLMAGLGAIYGLGYWPQERHPGNGRQLRLFWGLMVAGMGLLVISRHAMAFLLGWEVMTLAAFFLVSVEDELAECRRASWIYLIATHVGTLTLFALFALWRWATGSYALQPIASAALSPGLLNGFFVLALIGFGLKAGPMPLHFWLPDAHAAAPSHVSAMLSGILLKMGIYGLIRILMLLPDPPPAWGGLLLVLGVVSGLLGVVFAIAQHDLKRLLAYHSVENIGIILMGLGLAMLGRSTHQPAWVVLGMAGCLLHVWNHALFKSLLFLCAGSVVHGAHTRQIDHLGGLARAMPWTAATFLVGAVAICGLPPLNGFASEFLVYLGLLRTATTDAASASAAVIGAPVLAMVGALAVACFVKVYGAVFLGTPRSAAAADAHESPLAMRGPMVILAACCALIGLAPWLVTPILDQAIATWRLEAESGSLSIATLAPLGAVSALAVSLVAGAALLMGALAPRARMAARVGTWDCGYARPTSRMQYTASSFAQMIVAIFGWALRPHGHRPHVDGMFPRTAAMHTEVDDAVLDRVLLPAAVDVERWFGWFHRFQQGLTQHYVLYILIAVMLMLSSLIPLDELLAGVFTRR
ncbi:MAG TPA: proton-conducting transporter membrane subunit [Candidatus Dormibacteraeota bacterium]|nr:proton-conducting transporter membrane subunit [Candidatus Dormibacteraeota bacterium]